MKLITFFAIVPFIILNGNTRSFGQEQLPQLKKLVPVAGELVPAFSPGRYAYQVNVGSPVSAIGFELESMVKGTEITANGHELVTSRPLPLQVGMNNIEIKLKLGDKENIYHVRVLREHPTLSWSKVLENGPFPIRDSGGELVFKNKMWLLGGYFPALSSDVWHTDDGVNWRESSPIPAADGINIPLNYVYKDKMWVVSNDGAIYASADGDHWELVNANPPWGKRYAAGGVVFREKMWVFGGRENQGLLKNDIWWSEDGINWSRSATDAPWSPRQLFGNVVVKDDKIWIIGGGITEYVPFKAYRDVWVSADGIHWEEVTDNAPWPARIWSNCVVYRNQIFLLGGFRSQPKWENLGDVWYSKDGKNWQELKTPVSWEPRHEHSSYVFNDRLWVVGGNKWPLLNDVWSLDIKGLTFLSQPVLQELRGAGYTYYLNAEFNHSGQPVRYRLRKGPAWLKLDADRGLLYGTPVEAGTFEVTAEAYDKAGETTAQHFFIEVY